MTEQTGPPVWQHLVQWQPATAAALVQHIRALPDDWPLRVFGGGRPDAALTLEPGATGEQFPDRTPEIAPYDDTAPLEDCPACKEVEVTCRWHEGYAAGHHEAVQAQLDAVRTRPEMRLREFMRWQADVDEAEDQGQEPPLLPAAVSASPAPATERTALRERIAEALYERERSPRDPAWADAFAMDRETFEPMADAVLAVLPAPDQQAAITSGDAAVMGRAADIAEDVALRLRGECLLDQMNGAYEVMTELRRLAGEARADRDAWTDAADWLDALPLSGVEGGVRTALTGLLRDQAREARQDPTQDGTERRETVLYFLQSRPNSGQWESSSTVTADLAEATRQLAKRRGLVPDVEYRLAKHTTTVVVQPLAEQPTAVARPGQPETEA
ncbi:hypothetical protein AB0N17_03190 [Streptomyces sp. NPDC051133]|uniref:hypothetical protein n=1 Tax=Streptomyces sp. NPDC051133 TaxID=3155521 RepID=UPI00341369A4